MEKPDTIDAAGGPLTVQPVEHASLILSQAGRVLYVDPVGGVARYKGLAPPTAIAVTHHHGDHFDTVTLEELVGTRQVPILVSRGVLERLPAGLAAKAQVVGYGERVMLDGIGVLVVAAYNTTPERLRYHPRGLGNGYAFDFAGIRAYVAGDTEPNPDMLGLEGVGVAFLPMNLPYTMVAGQAAEAAKAFRPRIVYPFHYSGGPEARKFADLMRDETGIEVRLRDWYPGG